jgi:tetratricopeptide (TPR) repeat protein
LEDAAIEAYTYALTLRNDPQTRYLLGIALSRQGKYEEGISMLATVSGYAPAFWQQGFLQLDLGNAEIAEEQFTLAKKMDSTAVAPIIGLARTHLLLNQPNKSIALLQYLVEQQVNHSYINYLLGTAHQRAGNTKVAMKLLNSTQSGQPKWKDPWLDDMRGHQRGFSAELNRAIQMIDANNLQGALSAFQAIDKKYPFDQVVSNNLATIYIQLGKQEDAIRLLGDAIRKSPDYAPLRLTMGYALAGVGEIDKAILYAKEALTLQPSMFAAATLIGNLSTQQKNYQQALRYFAQAIGIGDTNPRTREMLAETLLHFKQWDKAISEYNIVLAISPSRTGSIGGLAYALASKGELIQAREVLSEAMLSFPNDPNLNRAATAIERIQR